MQRNLFVFDIETIPDLEAAKNLLKIDGDRNFLRDKLREYHLEITQGKNAFFRQPFHKIVAISFLTASIQYDDHGEHYTLKEIRSGGTINSTELELVQGFFHYLSQIKPRIISFNGKTFDMPVLKYRAMVYDISAKWLYQSGDKWSNYNSKYQSDWHLDLLDVFSDFGSSARIKMNEVCAVFGLPGKTSIDGSQVEEYYYDGRIEEIRNYCESDVINTYLLYLKYAHHSGKISKDSYEVCTRDLEQAMSLLTK